MKIEEMTDGETKRVGQIRGAEVLKELCADASHRQITGVFHQQIYAKWKNGLSNGRAGKQTRAGFVQQQF